MMRPLGTALAACALMVLAAAGAYLLSPTKWLADTQPTFNLELVVPAAFGEWRIDDEAVSTIVNPQAQALSSHIYNQVLTRSYVNGRNGERVMLSIAYGRDQRDALALHYPEVCYPAYGFQIRSRRESELPVGLGVITVTRLEAVRGNQRFEPISYWAMMGDKVTSRGLPKKLQEMRYGMKGEIPDGLLFRVSSINRNSVAAFALQDNFIKDLLLSLPLSARLRLAGLKESYASPGASNAPHTFDRQSGQWIRDSS